MILIHPYKLAIRHSFALISFTHCLKVEFKDWTLKRVNYPKIG